MSDFAEYDCFYRRVRRLAERSLYGIIPVSACITSGDFLNKLTYDPRDRIVTVVTMCLVADGKPVPVKQERYLNFVALKDDNGMFVRSRCPDRAGQDIVIRDGDFRFVNREE